MKFSQFTTVLESLGFKLEDLPIHSDSKRTAFAFRDLELGHALVVCRYLSGPGYYIGLVGGSDGTSSEFNNKEFLIDRKVYTAEEVIKMIPGF